MQNTFSSNAFFRSDKVKGATSTETLKCSAKLLIRTVPYSQMSSTNKTKRGLSNVTNKQKATAAKTKRPKKKSNENRNRNENWNQLRMDVFLANCSRAEGAVSRTSLTEQEKTAKRNQNKDGDGSSNHLPAAKNVEAEQQNASSDDDDCWDDWRLVLKMSTRERVENIAEELFLKLRTKPNGHESAMAIIAPSVKESRRM